ncbi:zinc metalloprotease [Scheffersomyces coipomensis]|uniref:zinc metalloprotease n=1 Tax=Scheffersomyces coipomensis TaxID=1788519 RepID=UPI00315D4EB5
MFSLAQTFSFLDNPNIDWKLIITGLTIGRFAVDTYLEYRQYQVLKRTSPPATLKSEVSQETFDKSQAYSRSKAKFGFFTGTISLIESLITIKYDLLYKFWDVSGSLLSSVSFLLPKFMNGVITQSIILFSIAQLVSIITSLPTSYYYSFVLEEKYGFNKQTISLWITDKIKGFALTLVLGAPVVAAFLKIIDYFGDSFIVYTMFFVLIVQLVFMTIFPTLIQPLFNKFTPLEDGKLKEAIEDLASKQKFPLTNLYVIDGSKRSSHSNAYFTGLPWSKQIVLFDTLIDHSSIEETVAVLAHEIGHWKLNHLPKMLSFAQIHLFLLFSSFSAFIHNKSLFTSFGFTTVHPSMVGFLLFSDIFGPLEFVLQFAMNLLSRKHEYEADAYAKSCGYSADLSTSLIKLLSKNLSTMDADWLYSSYHHSHPILSERLDALGYVSKGKVGSGIKPIKED